MNCLSCNTPNEEGAKFCKNCGANLGYYPTTTTTNTVDRQSFIYLLIVMAWEHFTWIIWLVVQKLVVPRLTSSGSWEKVNLLYKATGWFVDGISVLVLLVFSIIIRNNTARIFLIIFTVLRIIMLIAYRVMDSN